MSRRKEPSPERAGRASTAGDQRIARGGARGPAHAVALAQTNAMLREAVAQIPSGGGSIESLARALALVCRHTDWACGEAWMPSEDEPDVLVTARFHAAVERVTGFVDVRQRHRIETSDDLPARCWRDGRPVVVADVAQEPVASFARLDMARLYGLHTAVAVPAIGPDGPHAALVFFSDRVRPVEPEILEGISAVGTLLSGITSCLRAAGSADLTNRRQTVLSEILALALRDRPLDDLLPEALRLVLSMPGLALRPMGAVFLAEETGTELRMAAAENMPPGVRASCASVPFGTCVCGQAAQSGSTVSASDVDDLHSTSYEGIEPHGHYAVPLQAAGRTLGVLCLYTDPGHPADPNEALVVENAARAVSGLVLRSRLTGDLALSRASFAEMVRHAPMGIIVVGADGRIRFANESVERLFGLEPGEAVGTRPDEHLELRGGEAVVTNDHAPSLLRVVRSPLLWGGEAAEMIVLGDITAERVMEKVQRTVVGAHYPDIARQVIERGAVRYPLEERPISVLLIDIVDSTRMVLEQGGVEFAAVLGILYDLAVDAVAASGGSVNNLIGDSVMAVFNAPVALPDHPWRAAEAGARFLGMLATYRRDHPDEAFDVHIAVETGPALVGDVGPEERYIFTVTGACVPVASRLTKLPIHNRVVVGPGTADALAGRVTFTPYGPVEIRGIDGEEYVYLMGEDG